MTQVVQHVEGLSENPLAASEMFYARHLATARRMIAEGGVSELAVVFPVADSPHDDWRRGLARELAREFKPIRANVVGASDSSAVQRILAYLRDAPGVTGQYLAAHE